jgi:predicted aspartyl protease
MTSILNLTKTMGKVYTKLTVTNRGDQFLAKRGLVSEEQVRSLTLEQVLVDTGATTLCLPAEIIEELGLELLKEVDVATAMGLGKARIFQDAKISVHGREGTFECLSCQEVVMLCWGRSL